MQFCKSLLHFLMARKEERAPKSQPTERGGEEAGEREKKEDRRKIFSAPTCTPIHPPTTTLHTISTKREKEGATREKDACLWPTFNTCQKRARRRKRGGEKAAESEENIFGRLSNSPFRPPPPYHTPYPLTRLIEPFDER